MGGLHGPVLKETVEEIKMLGHCEPLTSPPTPDCPALTAAWLPSVPSRWASGARESGRNHSLDTIGVSFLVICLLGFVWGMYFGSGQAGGMR